MYFSVQFMVLIGITSIIQVATGGWAVQTSIFVSHQVDVVHIPYAMYLGVCNIHSYLKVCLDEYFVTCYICLCDNDMRQNNLAVHK